MGTRESNTIIKIFIGLLFSFFFVEILSLNVITTIIGSIFLAAAMFELKNESSPFAKAFIFSLMQLGVSMVNIILLFATDSFKSIFSLLNVILLGIVIFYIFDGLRIVLLNCDSNKRIPILWVLPLYIITVLIRVASMIFIDINILRYISAGVTLAIFIVILVMVIMISGEIKNSQYIMNKDKLKFLYLAPILIVGVIVGSGYFIINFINNKTVESIEYIQNDSDQPENVAAIKEQMTVAGFPSDILADLPDSEILKYYNVFNVTSKSETVDLDGGTINLTAVTSYMDTGDVRFMQYFSWSKLPTGKFVDLIGLGIETKKVIMLPDAECDGIILYSKNNKTFKTNFIDKDIALKYPKAKYKVVSDAVNLRGYLAIDTILAHPDQITEYDTNLVYAHQKNVFNFPYANSFDFFRLGHSATANKYVFDTHKLKIAENYTPKNYDPAAQKQPSSEEVPAA